MISADVQVFFQDFDLRFTSEELSTLGRMARTAPIDNIQRQLSPTGTRLKQNKPATEAMKRREGKPHYALLDEFHQLVETGSYAITHGIDRLSVFVEPSGLHAVKQSRTYKKARRTAAEARRLSRSKQANKATRETAGRAALWYGEEAKATARTGPGPNMAILIGWLEDKGYFFFGITAPWADALELRIAKMLTTRVDEYMRVNVERLRSTLGAA